MSLRTRITGQQERQSSFATACLPKLNALAKAFALEIDSQLERADIEADWPYLDRVVAWLSPSLHDDVRAYHAREQAEMCEIYSAQHIEAFDRLLVEQLLRQLTHDPATAHLVRQLIDRGVIRLK